MTQQHVPTVDETTSLLRVLQDEVQRLRVSERGQSEEAERNDREVKRTVVMLQLTHDQLQLIKESNVKLKIQLADSQQKVAQLQADLSTKEEEATHATRVLLETTDAHKEVVRRHDAEISIWKQKMASQENVNKVLRDEIAALSARLEDTSQQKDRESRSSFESKTALEVRLKQKTTELADLEILREKERKEVTAREYELSKLVSELKKSIDSQAERFESERKLAFVTTTTLKAENEDVKNRLSALQKNLDLALRDHIETSERQKREISSLSERLEEANSSHKARERALEAQTANFCAALKSAQSEINSLADREGVLMRDNADSLVTLHARHDATKLRNEELEKEVDALKEKLRSTIVSHAAALDHVKAEANAALRQQQEATTTASQALQHKSMDLRVTEGRLRAVEEELNQHVDRSSKVVASQVNDISALRAELEGYRNAVKKLEDHIASNYEVRVLTEQNESLREEVHQLKERVRHSNQSLANLRVEADISEGYRTSLMQEQLDSELSRVSSLEKERRASRTLLTALVEFNKKNGTLDLSLSSEIDQFYRVFGRGS